MRPKHFRKKLVLNKQNVSSLNRPQMDDVKGGDLPPSGYTCILCDSNRSCPEGPAACFQYPGGTWEQTCLPQHNCVSNEPTYCDYPCMPM